MTNYLATTLIDALRDSLQWDAWSSLIADRGIVIDRPRRSQHPRFPDIIYPIDYGYIEGTLGTDHEPVDVFIGSADSGLVGAIITIDYRRGDCEAKFIYNCSPEEIYLVNGFINYDVDLMRGRLVLRRPMEALWE